MKLFGVDTKGTGKLGGSVYVINHGVQIRREYNGVISNPSTDDQVSQRSRFKLASQVSAALAPVIVIPRKGLQSPRNLFTKKNMGYFYGTPQGAQVTYENLQITPGCTSLPRLVIARNGQNTITYAVAESVVGAIDHLVYSVFKKMDDESLILMESVVVDVTADNDAGAVERTDPQGNLVVYAYGIREKNARAHAIYGNYQIESGQDIAKLVANRTIEMDNFQFTQTRGSSIGAGDSENPTPDPGSSLLYLSYPMGAQIYVQIGAQAEQLVSTGYVNVPDGSQVRLRAASMDGYIFEGWYNNGEQIPFSTSQTATFTMQGMRDVLARYVNTGGLE